MQWQTTHIPKWQDFHSLRLLHKDLLWRLFAVLAIYASPVMATDTTTSTSAPLPGFTPALPTLPLNLGEKGNFNFSDQTTSYNFASDRVVVKANAGWGYTSHGNGVLGLDIASLVGNASSVGVNLNYQPGKFEAVLHHVKYWVPAGWRWNGAISYLQGRQQFDFFRSSDTARLSQLSYYGSVDWLDTGKLDLGLQSLGLSTWGGKSKNHSQFAAQNYIDDTPDYFLITRDARRLSEGRLFGTAVNFQYAAGSHLNWVFKGSVGGEWLKFPFSDGSAESHKSLYADTSIHYQFDKQNLANLGYKRGAVENRIEIGWQRGAMGLSSFYSKGQNGLQNQYGMQINVNLLALFNKTRNKDNDDPLAIRMRPMRHAAGEEQINSVALLQEALLRPTQLPNTFMVKVDPTAVKQIRVEKATLPSNAAIGSTGNIYIPVTEGISLVSSAQMNGQSISNLDSQFSVQGNQLVVIAQNLPVPTNTDYYQVQVKDTSTDETYIVTFNAVSG